LAASPGRRLTSQPAQLSIADKPSAPAPVDFGEKRLPRLPSSDSETSSLFSGAALLIRKKKKQLSAAGPLFSPFTPAYPPNGGRPRHRLNHMEIPRFFPSKAAGRAEEKLPPTAGRTRNASRPCRCSTSGRGARAQDGELALFGASGAHTVTRSHVMKLAVTSAR
jgi:hypothetical protein